MSAPITSAMMTDAERATPMLACATRASTPMGNRGKARSSIAREEKPEVANFILVPLPSALRPIK